MSRLLPLLLAFTAVPPLLAAGGSFSFYRIKPEQEQQFLEGYARHLRWHVEAKDPWPWYVWKILNGERRGHYTGGSFGHPWSEFGARPRPLEDRLDHQQNIDRHLETAVLWFVERRNLPQNASLERFPFVTAFFIEIDPAQGARFAKALRGMRGGRESALWWEVVSGGAHPSYLVLAGAASMPEAMTMRWETLGLERSLAAVRSIRSELWQFRPEISTCLSAESRCLSLAASAPR